MMTPQRQWLSRLTAGGVFGSPPGGLRVRSQPGRQQRLAGLAEEGSRVPTLGGASTSRVGNTVRAQPVFAGTASGGAHHPGSDRRAHHGLHRYAKGTDRAKAEDLGGHRAQRLGVSWDLKAGIGGVLRGSRVRSQHQDDSGLPGSLQEVLTGPHPAVLGSAPS